MKFPETKFKHELKMNPDLSSFIVFQRMIAGTKMPKFFVGKYFLKLVDKKDYDSADEEALINHLYRRTTA